MQLLYGVILQILLPASAKDNVRKLTGPYNSATAMPFFLSFPFLQMLHAGFLDWKSVGLANFFKVLFNNFAFPHFLANLENLIPIPWHLTFWSHLALTQRGVSIKY